MVATFISDLETPVEFHELAVFIADGHHEIMGSDFETPESMACGLAQLGLECGLGKKNHRYDFHNEKKTDDWDGLWTQYKCDEIFDVQTAMRAKRLDPFHCIVSQWKDGPNQRCVLLPPHPWSSFVAFDGDPGDDDKTRREKAGRRGAGRYIDLLADLDRYSKAWHALRIGDPHAFSHELRAAGYYTADEDVYTAGLVSIATHALPLCSDILKGRSATFTPDAIENIQALSTLALANVIWMPDRHVELAA